MLRVESSGASPHSQASLLRPLSVATFHTEDTIMRSSRARIALLIVSFAAAAGCGSSGGSSPTAPSAPLATTPPAAAPTPTPALSVAGTWTGTLTPGDGKPQARITAWTATQSGTSVSGPVRFEVGRAVLNGTLAGTVTDSQLTSATFTVVADGTNPAPCSFSGTGTVSAAASLISGGLAMTFPASCVGPTDQSVSTTATATWTLSLTK